MQYFIIFHYIVFSLYPTLISNIYHIGFIEIYLSYTKKEIEGRKKGRREIPLQTPGWGIFFPINIRKHYAYDSAAHLPFGSLN